MNHDIEDAMAAGVLHACDIPREITQALGETKSQRITSLIAAVVAHGPEHIGMAPEWQAAYDALHAFMYSTCLLYTSFAILNPKYTLTLPHYQMVAGIYDIFNHICEQYFSGEDDNTSDYISEGLMRSLLHSSRIANKNPQNYEARSNIMWAAAWALNTLVAKGKAADWMVHMLGQAVGAYTNATHGMTLAAVSLPYYRYICLLYTSRCV